MNAKKIAFFACILTSVFAVSLENGLYPRMVAVMGGTFYMGSNEGVYRVNERAHEVTLRPFRISEAPITQELYAAVMKENPSWFKGGENPVDSVSWFDAVYFCNALSEQAGLSPAYSINGEIVTWNRESRGFRLPTEAEWEFAARGGLHGALGEPLGTAAYAGGLAADDLAWYSKNSGRRTQPVKKKLPNELGLFDMTGNVWEWCWDWFGDYPLERVYDPDGALSGRHKVHRGGSFMNLPNQLRVTFRVGNPPLSKANSVGFRIVQNW